MSYNVRMKTYERIHREWDGFVESGDGCMESGDVCVESGDG